MEFSLRYILLKNDLSFLWILKIPFSEIHQKWHISLDSSPTQHETKSLINLGIHLSTSAILGWHDTTKSHCQIEYCESATRMSPGLYYSLQIKAFAAVISPICHKLLNKNTNCRIPSDWYEIRSWAKRWIWGNKTDY